MKYPNKYDLFNTGCQITLKDGMQRSWELVRIVTHRKYYILNGYHIFFSKS